MIIAHNKLFQSIKNAGLIILICFLAADVLLLSIQNQKLKNALEKQHGLALVKGQKAPEFTAWKLNGGKVMIEYDKPTLLFIFTTQCDACIDNLYNWRQIADGYKNSNLNIVGVSLDDLQETDEFVFFNEITFPVYIHPDSIFQREFNIRATPQTIAVDKRGKVRKSWPGLLDSQRQQEIVDMF